jgi:hypothetical protein
MPLDTFDLLASLPIAQSKLPLLTPLNQQPSEPITFLKPVILFLEDSSGHHQTLQPYTIQTCL